MLKNTLWRRVFYFFSSSVGEEWGKKLNPPLGQSNYLAAVKECKSLIMQVYLRRGGGGGWRVVLFF